MKQPSGNGEKPTFGTNSSQVLPLLDVRHCRKLSSYSISRKAYDPNKPNIGPDLGPFGPNLGPQNFFIKLVVRHCPNLSSYAMSRITNEPNLREWQENLISGMVLVILSKFVPPPPNFFRRVYLY